MKSEEKYLTKIEKMNIQETILAIRKEMSQKVAKNGFNKFHKYKFAKATDIIAHCRELCNYHGLVILPMGIDQPVQSKNGTVVSGNAMYNLCAEDGTSINVAVFAAGEDKGDKHAYKMMTGALKYLFMQIFLLETDDDPEATEGGTPEKPKMSKKQIEKAKDKIDEEGEAYLLKIQEHFALTQEQEIEFTEYINYTKG
jgi:hypothetical protein